MVDNPRLSFINTRRKSSPTLRLLQYFLSLVTGSCSSLDSEDDSPISVSESKRKYMHQEFWTSCWIARHCGLAGSEKWASTSPYWITSSGLASGVSREELPFEANYKCRNKEKTNQRYFKGKLSFYYFLATSF